MNRSYDKPFMDYDGMINLMQSSNIDIDNCEFAIQSLRDSRTKHIIHIRTTGRYI